MKIVVTGASGFVGRAIVQRLLRDGHRVAAWTRSPERTRALLGSEVEIIPTDWGQLALDEAVDGSDAVINLAGENLFAGRWTESRKRALVDSRLSVTRAIVHAIEVSRDKPRALVSTSAIGYYGDRGAVSLDEEASVGEGFLADLCWRWEHEAEAARAFGTRVAIMRVGIVLGPEGGALSRLLPVFRAGLGGRLGDGRQYFSWIHLDDLVEGYVRALVDSSMDGAFNATAPQPVTNRELTRTLARVVARPALLPAPGPMVRLALGEAADVLLGGQRVLPQGLLGRGFEYRYEELEAALHAVAHPTGAPDIIPDPVTIAPELTERRAPQYLLAQRTVIDAPIDEVFPYFSSPENLGALTPPWMGFSIMGEPPAEIRAGTTIDYRIAVGPVPMTWRTVIEQWDERDYRFVDDQRRGPYRLWWHEHRFTPRGDRTVMEDRVFYSLRFGIVGRIAHRLFVAPMLRRIFNFRADVIARRFGAPAHTVRRAA